MSWFNTPEVFEDNHDPSKIWIMKYTKNSAYSIKIFDPDCDTAIISQNCVRVENGVSYYRSGMRKNLKIKDNNIYKMNMNTFLQTFMEKNPEYRKIKFFSLFDFDCDFLDFSFSETDKLSFQIEGCSVEKIVTRGIENVNFIFSDMDDCIIQNISDILENSKITGIETYGDNLSFEDFKEIDDVLSKFGINNIEFKIFDRICVKSEEQLNYKFKTFKFVASPDNDGNPSGEIYEITF